MFVFMVQWLGKKAGRPQKNTPFIEEQNFKVAKENPFILSSDINKNIFF